LLLSRRIELTKKYTVSFHPTSAPITEPVTKFGGQPVWLTEPEWPLSKETGEPMRFIGQVALYSEIFDGVEGKMAYIFMSDGEDYVDGTWEPEGGENAVIIQPNGDNVETKSLVTGPSLYQMEEREGSELLHSILCEFSVELRLGDDPERGFEDDTDGAAYEEVKIGGTPIFLQGEEYPEGGGWRLLLQMDSASVPFHVNFGDAGVGYAFISGDGNKGRFLWQCG
jgi:uncharacterized protein YwqG